MRKRSVLLLSLLIALLGLQAQARAVDRLVLPADTSPQDNRWVFPLRVLTKAMEATQDTDGPFCIGRHRLAMHFARALNELADGQSINVGISTARREWDERAIPVRIPIYRGLKSYYLLQVNRKSLGRFRTVRTLEDFRPFRGGVVYQWALEDILDQAGCELVKGSNYEGLFSMLAARRFDYIPRPLVDAFDEAEERTEKNPELDVEPTLALYIPSPQYFYVSPARPHLADRIRRGMRILRDNGTLERLVHETFDEAIRRADLGNRRILRIDNPLLPEGTPVDSPEKWLAP